MGFFRVLDSAGDMGIFVWFKLLFSYRSKQDQVDSFLDVLLPSMGILSSVGVVVNFSINYSITFMLSTVCKPHFVLAETNGCGAMSFSRMECVSRSLK